jgi:hypothetical protein
MEEEKRLVTDHGKMEAVLFRALKVVGPLSLLLRSLFPKPIKFRGR